MQKYTNTILDRLGNAVVGASIAVYQAGTTSAVPIYSDDGVTPVVLPLQTNINGEFSFCAANGTYDLYITGTGYPARTWAGVQLYDLSESDSPWFDVTDSAYGADPTGATDSTVAIQGAIDDAEAQGWGTVYLPGGTYEVTHLTVTDDIHLVGAGHAATTINFTTATQHGLAWTGAGIAENKPGSRLADLALVYTGAGQAANKHGLYVTRKIIAERVLVTGFTYDGVHFYSVDANLETPYFCTMANCRSNTNGRHGLHITDNCNANIFIDCQFSSNTGDGVHHETTGATVAHNNIFIGGQASYNGGDGYDFVNGTHLYVFGCYSEFNTGAGIRTTVNNTSSWIGMGPTVGNGTDIVAGNSSSMYLAAGGWLKKAFETTLQPINFGDAGGTAFKIFPGTPGTSYTNSGREILLLKGYGNGQDFVVQTELYGTVFKAGDGVDTYGGLRTNLDRIAFGNDATSSFWITPFDEGSDYSDGTDRVLLFTNTGGAGTNGYDFAVAGGSAATPLKIRGSHVIFPMLAADPGAPAEGWVWYNTTDHKLRCRDNAVTRDLF